MKKLLTLFTLILGLSVPISQAQSLTISGQTAWGDSVRWGGTVDSTSTLKFIGNALRRDSLGTYVVITTDSCSKWVRITQGGQHPIARMELDFDRWTSSANTDSSQAKFRIDSRNCKDARARIGCDSIVAAGNYIGDATTAITDTLTTPAINTALTWIPTSMIYNVPHGDLHRVCVDNFITGGQAVDSLKFRRFVIRVQ